MLIWLLLRMLLMTDSGSAGDGADGGADGEGDDDDDSSGGDDDAADGDDANPVRDAKLKAVHDEAAKWRHKLREAQAKLKKRDEAGGPVQDALRSARIELAF